MSSEQICDIHNIKINEKGQCDHLVLLIFYMNKMCFKIIQYITFEIMWLESSNFSPDLEQHVLVY